MIIVENRPFEIARLDSFYPPGSIERKALEILSGSDKSYAYDSLEQLRFELELRGKTVSASYELNRSGMSFEVFRDTRCNGDYWTRRSDGGFVLKRGVKASDAILDIYRNGSQYGTECATAMQIVYYKALLDVFREDAFNEMFPEVTLMNWRDIESELRETGRMQNTGDFVPGDRLYFANPDVDPKTPHWQGENVIDLGNGTYYGHGMGIRNADFIIRALNGNRREGAGRSAFLMDAAGRPNFRRLYALYSRRSAA
ncbi:MAG: protein-glutamine gamma-glutamyltransferase [Oscillospiraceae bacterium]|jgi:protein-glutamine gamma-glutamyltransferase